MANFPNLTLGAPRALWKQGLIYKKKSGIIYTFYTFVKPEVLSPDNHYNVSDAFNAEVCAAHYLMLICNFLDVDLRKPFRIQRIKHHLNERWPSHNRSTTLQRRDVRNTLNVTGSMFSITLPFPLLIVDFRFLKNLSMCTISNFFINSFSMLKFSANI